MGDQTASWKSPRYVEMKLVELLGPIEPIVMRLQSLLVWERPRCSAILFLFVHFLFWVVATCCVQVYSLVSLLFMAIFFMDTWKKKIWPEIRVPPPVPEDTDGWTPVHPRLLSVPEISHHLSQIICSILRFFESARYYRREKPFLFFLFCSALFTTFAILGSYLSGFMIIYTLVVSAMVWPSVIYHNLLKRAYLKMEPAFMWLDYQLKSKCYIRKGKQPAPEQVSSVLSASKGHDGRGVLAQVVEEVEEEDFIPSIDPLATAALARAITDSEDEGTSSLPTPGLSKEPSLNDSDEERKTDDFGLDVDAMPSFDDLDNSDDEMTSPSLKEQGGAAGDITFTQSHFESDSDDDLEPDLSFPNASQTVLSNDTDATSAALTSTLVTKTLTSIMESALQGMMGFSGGQASSSGVLPRIGTKITYTKTSEGECFDFATPEPTIAEDDEGCDPSDDENMNSNAFEETVNEVAEIERDFDFLDELEDLEGKNAQS